MRVVLDTNVVLTYPRIRSRLRYSDEQVQRFLRLLREYAVFLEDLPAIAGIATDPDDDKFLTLAKASGATHIISGDEHLLTLGAHEGVAIVTPAAFLAALPATGGE